MNHSKSDKIRLLLNELAILNQPEVIGGSFYFNGETLLKIKQLSAELYLNADRLLPGDKKTEYPEVAGNLTIASPGAEENLFSKPEIAEDNIAEVNVEEVAEEVVDTDQTSIEEVNAQEEITSPEVTPDSIPEPRPEPVAEVHSQTEPEPTVDVFAGKISLTRRFEYINNLFAGDEAQFQQFLMQLSAAQGYSAASALFDAQYNERNWKRKSETADDLKILIRKYKS